MKAIAQDRDTRSLLAPAALAGAVLLALGSCSMPPPPAPVRSAPLQPPATVMLPAPPPAAADWRDAPPSPGTWRWGVESGRSTARWIAPDGATTALIACNRDSRTVLLARAGAGTAPVALAVTTTATAQRTLLSEPAASPPGMAGVWLPARDPLLDAMAFSRGRFVFDLGGGSALYLPSWPEIGRVIEDCRDPAGS